MITLKDVEISLMECSGYKAKIMEADRLRGEQLFGLPTGRAVNVVPLACLPGAPEEWVRSPGTYVVPVDSEMGLWFDWTMNESYNTGIIPSVKGMNPITGQKIDELRLEQYRDTCPVHKKPFAHNLYCEECKFEWSGQNHISHPNILWWDGFRQPDGSVRQFFFTEDEARDVASAVIGKKNTVPAFGFAFFRSKREKPVSIEKDRRYFGFGGGICGQGSYKPAWYVDTKSLPSYSTCQDTINSSAIESSISFTSQVIQVKDQPLTRSIKSEQKFMSELSDTEIKPYFNNIRKTTDVSVGAGARINQKLEIDTLPLEQWFPEPQALIRLYFVFSEQLQTIVRNGGIKKLENVENGYMNEKVEVG